MSANARLRGDDAAFGPKPRISMTRWIATSSIQTWASI